MILLYGRSPSGKTTYFMEQHKDQEVRILHASSLTELRANIASTASIFNDPVPTLINVWYDMDCSFIADLQHYDVYVEAHYLETPSGLTVRGSGNGRYYYGLKNEMKIRERKQFIKNGDVKPRSNVDWIGVLGTRYNYLKSIFPELVS